MAARPSKKWKQLNQEIESCQKCPRLIKHCHSVATLKRKAYQDEEYWGAPVGNFGVAPAQLLVVGLAPGAHGANRTGRMFTGDRSGEWLFRGLHRAGFASRPNSVKRTDRLRLTDCSITNICHCAPPDNRPTSKELVKCRPYLDRTIDLVQPTVFLALGGLAWKAIVRVAVENKWLENPSPAPKFGHGEQVELLSPAKKTKTSKEKSDSRRWLVGSYHPSQQNTFTGRLTEKMFDEVFEQINLLIQNESQK